MKIFSWMQSKLSAKHDDKRANALPSTDKKNPKEEFDDWPNGLLSIGTMGYKDDVHKRETSELVERSLDTNIPRGEECSSPDFSEFTTEEVRSLQKELTKLLRQKSTSKAGETTADLPLDKFLNCPSILEVDLDSNKKGDEDIDRTIRIILGRCKDACEKKRAMLGKKSLSFLVKKLLVCRGGFASTPSLRDAFQQSRMEKVISICLDSRTKLMRAMLANKIHPRDSYGTLSINKSIEDYRHVHNTENEERLHDKNRGGFKWDKTDSEFIVLEI